MCKEKFVSDCKEPQHMIEDILVSTLVKTIANIYTYCVQNVALEMLKMLCYAPTCPGLRQGLMAS